MPDTPITRLFEQLTAEPDPDFVAALEARLIDELATTPSTDRRADANDPVAAARVTLAPQQPRGPKSSVAATARPRRRLGMVVLIAAAAVVAIVIVIATSGNKDHRVIKSTPPTLEQTTTSALSPTTTSTPATAVPPTLPPPSLAKGYVQDLSTELTTADGASFRFDGTVRFSIAVESNEHSEAASHDVLLLPQATGTFTNTGTAPSTLVTAMVQVFMAGDFPCVTTGSTCTSSITLARPATEAAVTLQPGEAYTLDVAATDSRVTVPAGDVAYIIDEIANGEKVVGTAVSVSDPGGQIATTVFDRSGKPVLTCTTLAVDCMDATRSVLGADAAPVDNSALGQLAFPAGAAPAGTYAPVRFVVPYQITTSGPWQLARDEVSATLLRRRDNTGLSALQIGDGATLAASSPEQVMTALRGSDTTPQSSPRSTTLFGQPAIEIDATVTAASAVDQTLRLGPLFGDAYRVVATTLDGRVIYVIGVAPSNTWDLFGPEFDATIASLTLR